MAKFNKDSGVGGAWIDKKALRTGDIMKLVTEAQEVPNQQGGTQIVAKAKIKGSPDEPKNVSINKPSKNALIDAFGDDSETWVDKLLTVTIEKTLISGKRGLAMYMVPEGFEMGEDDGGYIVIKRIGEKTAPSPRTEEEISPDDIPF